MLCVQLLCANFIRLIRLLSNWMQQIVCNRSNINAFNSLGENCRARWLLLIKGGCIWYVDEIGYKHTQNQNRNIWLVVDLKKKEANLFLKTC